MHFPRMLGWAETQTLRLATLQMCELMDFTVYKQVPKGTRKMKIFSRNFILASTAQKVLARISKQLPPSSRRDKQPAVPGQRAAQWLRRSRPGSQRPRRRRPGSQRLWRRRPGSSFPDDSAPAVARCCGASRSANGRAGPGRAGPGRAPRPRAPQRGTGVAAAARPCPAAGWEPGPLTARSRSGARQGGDGAGHGKPARQATADKQKLNERARKKD